MKVNIKEDTKESKYYYYATFKMEIETYLETSYDGDYDYKEMNSSELDSLTDDCMTKLATSLKTSLSPQYPGIDVEVNDSDDDTVTFELIFDMPVDEGKLKEALNKVGAYADAEEDIEFDGDYLGRESGGWNVPYIYGGEDYYSQEYGTLQVNISCEELQEVGQF